MTTGADRTGARALGLINVVGGICVVCRGVICGKYEETRCDCADRVTLLTVDEVLTFDGWRSPAPLPATETFQVGVDAEPRWHRELPAGITVADVERDLASRESGR